MKHLLIDTRTNEIIHDVGSMKVPDGMRIGIQVRDNITGENVGKVIEVSDDEYKKRKLRSIVKNGKIIT